MIVRHGDYCLVQLLHMTCFLYTEYHIHQLQVDVCGVKPVFFL